MRNISITLLFALAITTTASAQWNQEPVVNWRFNENPTTGYGGNVGVNDKLWIGYMSGLPFTMTSWNTIMDSTGQFSRYHGALTAGDVLWSNGTYIIAAPLDSLVDAITTDAVPSSRTISTTSPLTGGGDLSANRTISLPITDQQIVFGSGGTTVTSSSDFLYDVTDGTFAIHNTNSENYNLNLTDQTGRCELVITGTNSKSIFGGRYFNGTYASKTAALNNDVLTEFAGLGYKATGFPAGANGGMQIVAGENFTDTQTGTYLQWFVSPTGGTTTKIKLRLGTDGYLRVNGSKAASYPLDVSGDVNISTGSVYRINGTQISAANLSNGTTGSGSVVLATSPTLSGTTAMASATLSDKITSYNGITTSNNGASVSVGTPVHLTGQTAGIGATTLYTADADGFYTVTVQLAVTRTGGTSIGAQIRFTNVADNVQKVMPSNNVNGLNQCSSSSTGNAVCYTITAYCKSGTNIQYITNLSGSGQQYSVDAFVIKH